MAIFGTTEGDICPICNKTMSVCPDVDYKDIVYCVNCDIKNNYDSCDISYCSNIQIDDNIYSTFSANGNIIVTKNNTVIYELENFDGYNVIDLINCL